MADPRTIIVPGRGQNFATYELPPGVLQYVEAIVAHIDTSGSADVQPVLFMVEQSGQEIAVVQQGRVIDGGGSGVATWALRLDDEQTATTPQPPSGLYFLNGFQTIPTNTTTIISFNHMTANNGMGNLSTHPTSLIAPDAGLYLVSAAARWGLATNVSAREIYILTTGTRLVSGDLYGQITPSMNANITDQATAGLFSCDPGATFRLQVMHLHPGNLIVGACQLAAVKLSDAV